MTRLTQARIETLAREALTRHGASERQAEALAAAIAAAERDGLKSHGLMYLPTYCEHLTCGKVLGLAEPRLTRPAPAVVAVIWQGLFGQYAPLDAVAMLRVHLDLIFGKGQAA